NSPGGSVSAGMAIYDTMQWVPNDVAAAGLGLALLTLAGLPPAVVGLVAKVVALRPVASDGTWLLALVAALNVALGVAVYLRWAAVVAARPVPTEDPGAGEQPAAEPVPEVRWPWPHRVVSTGLALLLVLGSIAPVGIW
ncbi:ATP-dependent Clp protease proteolytic subunit, partial [Ornithinicoccus halotolerans]|uniref:ATP-dependent Clp protease proteolytic subunit n=1 Tax=Ornithinicoccus halotolerans TaxID=1748220 RepID=UPI002B21E9FE